jgi:ADP-heptose:LPS heptosyltransferase
LVNSYNAPILAGNPSIDHIYAYTKAKHSAASRPVAWGRQLRLYLTLRRQRFDLVIHANPIPHQRTERLVRFLRPRHALGVTDPDPGRTPAYDLPVLPGEVRGRHHVEQVFSLLQPLGIRGDPGPLVLDTPPRAPPAGPPRIAVHISSRKPCNRWPSEHFATAIQAIAAAGYRAVLLWAPGSAADAHHPGDDERAASLYRRLRETPVTPVRTVTVNELVATMATADMVVCCDGGTLHIAAALGKPTVALFGCTDPARWGPWGVKSRTLRGAPDAASIAPETVIDAMTDLARRTLAQRVP